jgi:hypothetical protein
MPIEETVIATDGLSFAHCRFNLLSNANARFNLLKPNAATRGRLTVSATGVVNPKEVMSGRLLPLIVA